MDPNPLHSAKPGLRLPTTPTTCPACASTRLEAAQLEGMALRLDRSSTLKKVFNVGGLVSCTVCLDCGRIFDLHGDPARLAQMIE